ALTRTGIMWPEDAPMYGRPLHAADVALSYEALREAGRRQARVYEAVDRIDVNQTDFGESVVFSLREPSAPLLNQMTSPWHVVLPAEVVSGAESVDLSQRSLGNGPFQLEQSDGRSNFVVTRNPSYDRMEFDGYPMPYLDQVRGEDYSIRNQANRDAPGSARWSAWESGVAQAIQLDGVGDVRRAREAQPDAQLQVTPPTPSGGGHFTFRSLTDGPFADVRVRAALSMALHRGSLAASVYGGLAAPDTAQNWTFFRDPQQTRYVALREWPWEEEELGEAQRYDPNRALGLLSAAGYSEGHPLQFGIDMPAALNPAGDPYDPGPHRLAEFVVEQWEQHLHGVMDVRRFERSWARFTDSRSDMRFRPEANPAVDLVFRDPADVEIYDVDADDLAFGSMHSTGRFNRAGINDPEIDEWAVAQRQTLDATERVKPLERMRLKEQDHIWRILLVNPYGVHIRRDHVLNLLGTYYAKTLHLAPDQLKRTRIGQRWGSE
ncbi:MAG: ABC transporter substrate-binding protein, partial [Chloroflexi bacterium]|nr:ABC transporter substrate-binding protein [Chloroflexota bacterium]